jgi:hypothetical protein
MDVPSEHSFKSAQLPSAFKAEEPAKPGLQLHWNEPAVFLHSASAWHTARAPLNKHSFLSAQSLPPTEAEKPSPR